MRKKNPQRRKDGSIVHHPFSFRLHPRMKEDLYRMAALKQMPAGHLVKICIGKYLYGEDLKLRTKKVTP